MAKIIRQTAQIFGSTVGTSQIAEFGSLAAGTPTLWTGPQAITNVSTIQATNWKSGWGAAVEAANSPALEDLNAFCFMDSYQLAYLLQQGVAEWDSGTTYYVGSLANDATGNVYVSISNANIANALSSTANWQPMMKLVNSGFVSNILAPTLAANQSITLPLVPSTSSGLSMSSAGVISTVSRAAGGTTAALGQVAAASFSGTFTTTNTSPTDVTGATFL